MSNNSIQITFRMPADVVKKLDEMCSLSNMKRSEYFKNMVLTDYDKIQGNPELKKLLEQMLSVKTAFDNFQLGIQDDKK